MLSKNHINISCNIFRSFGVVVVLGLSACTFQPLYAPSVDGSMAGNAISQIDVSHINTRVGQQVRNHLLFLINGGNASLSPRYRADLQITSFVRKTAAKASLRDTTAGFVSITASYNLIDTTTKKRIAGGTRTSTASFDRTSQIFTNQRAERDAENRAGIAVAEQLRNALASDLAN